MDDLNELAFFAKVVEAGSFTGAARALRVPKATVSRKVASLETRLGARLLHRTTRRIRLTELGEAYYRRCAEIMLSVEDAQSLVGGFLAAPRGRLRLSAPVAFGSTILADWVADFLLLDTAGRGRGAAVERIQYVDLLAEGIDVAFRAGPLQESSLVARRLGPVPYVMCAAPDYLREHGTPLSRPTCTSTHASACWACRSAIVGRWRARMASSRPKSIRAWSPTTSCSRGGRHCRAQASPTCRPSWWSTTSGQGAWSS